ncbi:SDR family NAD(P)-dependent oxidoreductase [Roseovarius sp. LXJ103]|uniref:type I polyketide synthase n=1 Tax=Roseovarius carneus TaxID=2853164 RepID=UPI000D603B6E|nr:type I polyketide synthase [Roseovarius carneus]MBZ8119284.1 SDR family NAD(P)-dependent oxidoreductase [Roseovarius carneus]PWE37205.1 polyketide synthase [Pelagicola sp. LXJ1103]
MLRDHCASRRCDIAIVGMAAQVPGAASIAEFWRNLSGGIESISRLSEAELRAAGEDPAKMRLKNYVPAAAVLDGFAEFDAEFFGFGPKDATILDPQHRKFLEVTWQAMEQAGHVPSQFGGRIGVYAGCGMGSYFYFNICSNPDLVEDTGMFLLRHTGNDKDFLSTRVSHVFDLKGPSINMQTACSTSLVAIHYARQALISGECDMALAGGVTIELPQGRGYAFKENEILSPDGHCHAFDHRAEGTVFGSGAGAVALRRLEDAVADGDHIWAVIKGSAINNDGAAKAGYLAPSVDGQAAAVRAALTDANVAPSSVGYIECHGTGTYLGDPIEVAALTEAYGQTPGHVCGIGSVKTNIGHLDTAAGVVGLIKTALSLHHKQIPASLGFEAPNPAIDFEGSPFHVNAALTEWAADGPRRAAVNSLGVGGTNAHVVLEEAPARAASDESDFPFQVLTLSARSKSALEASSAALAAYLRAHPGADMADLAWTLRAGRHGFDKRRVLVAETPVEAAALLEAGDPLRVHTHAVLAAPETVFMFPGGGVQYTGMARDLYETEPVFAEWMDRGFAHLEPQLEYDIRALWLPEPGQEDAAAETLKRPSVQLPLIMITEYALAQLWISWGVMPAALVGHSMGENTAACLAGVMQFEDCIDLVLLRGRLFDTVPAGGMLSVPLPLAELEPLIGNDLDIASVNAPALCAVSGPNAALEGLAARLKARDVETQRVAIDIAAHSRMLDPILDRFRSFVAGLDLKAPQMPVISNRTAKPLTAAQATDPDYWTEQLRQTVRFGDCIDALPDVPRVFLEVGPGKALSALAGMAPGVTPAQVLSSLRHPEQDMADDAFFLQQIGRLWACGVEADWDQIWGGARRVRLDLPTYPFQRSRYFIEPGQAAVEDTLARSDDIADWGTRPVWMPRLAECALDVEADLGPPLTWVIFEDDAGFAAPAIARLREAGHVVTTVRSGDSFQRRGEETYILAPEQGRAGYEALLFALAGDGRLPDRIAHFWLVTQGESFRPGSSFFDRNIDHGFFSLLHIAQAIGAVEMPSPCHITAFATGAADARGGGMAAPEKATLEGPIGVIPRELPSVTANMVDVELAAPPKGRHARTQPDHTNRLLEELLAEPSSVPAAWRGGKRFAKVLRPADLPEAGALYAEGGTYLITGGFGGIGLSVARDLAARAEANIVLLSRSALPPREAWGSYHGAGRTARRIAAVREIEAAGGRVHVCRADVTDIAQMRAARAEIEAQFGPLTGVFHAAGAIDDAPILAKDAGHVQAVFAPKIGGLRVLDEVFPDGTLDLMVLFSSTSALIHPAGQVDYVAANAYLSAFAAARVGAKTRIVAVNWGVWADTGMAADAMAARMGVAEPGEARALSGPVFNALCEDASGVRRFAADLSAEDWMLGEHRTRAGQIVLPGTGYIELAAQAMAAEGGFAPFELRDLYFLRALEVPEGGMQHTQLSIAGSDGALSMVVATQQRIGARTGLVPHAQAQIVPLGLAAPRIDVGAITARCDRQAAQPFVSPQEQQLDFGPRWRVVEDAAFGAGEGIAHLALPEAASGDLSDGYLAHPALLDLATGWAIALSADYDPSELWVPAGYGSVRIFAPLPARIVSWVRLARGGDAETATYDIVLATPEGDVVLSADGLQMRKLDAGLKPAALSERDMLAEPGADVAPLSPGETRLMRMMALGITAEEGPEALRRALSTGAPQIAISPMSLTNLMVETTRGEAARPVGQSFERPELDGDFRAPEGALQIQLAEMWSSLLGIAKVGAEDSFFDLGGHSLLAVRLFAQIKRGFGVDFPISVLFEAPSITALAALIEAQTGPVEQSVEAETRVADTPLRRHLVPLHPDMSGGRTPLFIVAGMFGNVLNLRHLALVVGRDRPVWGLQARGLIGDEVPHNTIADAARDYIAEMRQVQPEGPYMLGGFSGGGITALEMAQQLREVGEDVSMLAMLDTPLPVRPSLNRRDKALIKLAELRAKGPGYLLDWARARAAWEVEKRQGVAPSEEGSFNNAEIEQAFRAAVAAYHVAPWDGPFTLFRPKLDQHWKVSAGNWVNAAREYVYPDNQWAQYAPQIQVIEVPGDHDSMVLMPNVGVLAGHLSDIAAAADLARSPRRGSDTSLNKAAE